MYYANWTRLLGHKVNYKQSDPLRSPTKGRSKICPQDVHGGLVEETRKGKKKNTAGKDKPKGKKTAAEKRVKKNDQKGMEAERI